MRPDRVWYVAYGSNVNTTRFLRYLHGSEVESGARDTTPPRTSRWEHAPLRLVFAGQSTKWKGGGVAFVDDHHEHRAIVRAWDITTEQFEDIFHQENRRDVGERLDWGELRRGPIEVGSGWYSRVQTVSLSISTSAHPAVTFTWSAATSPNPPNPDYLATMRQGLGENTALAPTDIDAYLDTAVSNL